MHSSIDLKVGYLCNNRCIHCAISDLRKDLEQDGIPTELSTEEVISYIEKYSKDYNSITLTGGEISIRKDFIQILESAADKFEFVDIQTNGRSLNKSEVKNVLKKRKNIQFTIALHSSDEETHDKITRVRHSFSQTIEGIKAVAPLARVCVKYVITNFNKDDIFDFTKLVCSLRVCSINLTFVHGVGSAYHNLDEILPRYTDIVDEISKSIDYAKSHGVSIETESIPFCFHTLANFDVVSELKLISMKCYCLPVNDEEYNWNIVRLEENRAKSNKCNDCVMSEVCEGVWKEYISHYGDLEFTPVFSGKAKISKQNAHNHIQILRLIDADYRKNDE